MQDNSLQKLKLLALENSGFLTAIFDANRKLLWANDLYLAERNLELNQANGKTCYQLSNKDSTCMDCPVEDAIKTKQRVILRQLPGQKNSCLMLNSRRIFISSPIINEKADVCAVSLQILDFAADDYYEKSICSAELRYWQLFDTMIQGVVYQNADGHIISANPAAAKILGVSVADMLDRTSENAEWEGVNEMGEAIDGSEHPAMVALRTGKPVDKFIMGVRHQTTGDRVWMSVSAAPLFREGEKKPYQVYATIEDITARKNAEDEYKSLFSEMLNGFALHEIICDDKGAPIDYRFLAINPAFEKMTGLKGSEVIGRTLLEIFPESETLWIERYGKVAITGEPAHFENHSAALGKTFEVTAFSPEKGRFACIFSDVTERIEAIKELLDSQERFKALHNASFGGITIHDKGLILECNLGLANMTGYTVEELVGMDGLLLIAEKSRAMVRSNIAAGYEKPYEAYGQKKNGEEYPIRLEARNIPYKGKQVRVVEFRDLSEARLAEIEKEKLQNQLLQAQKMESIGRLAGGVAHDFNNMLGVIIGHSELVLEKLSPEHPFYDDLVEIKKAANRSANLTQQLLAFARKQTVTPILLNVNEAIENMLKMLSRLIGEDLNLLWRPSPEPAIVKIDPAQLDQILANLCVNARDAIPATGRIMIEIDSVMLDSQAAAMNLAAGKYVVISFSDNGCGMSPETKARIFEPFFTTKEQGKGTGLGLATIYGIVQQNNGMINVYSELNRGTTFKIYLPGHAEEAVRPVTRPTEDSGLRGTETILLVEDEPAILKITSIMLERMGYKVIAAPGPKAALKILLETENSIDMLLTDVIMPEMNGRELAASVKRKFPDLKCLFMSGYTANVIAAQGVLDAEVNFIHKPFSIADLAKKVREAITG